MLATEFHSAVESTVAAAVASVPSNIVDEESVAVRSKLVAANGLGLVSSKRVIASQHLTAMNDFHSPSCRTERALYLAQTVAVEAVVGDDGDDGASSDDAYVTGGTLVECFECLTFALELQVEPFSSRLKSSVGCSTVAVARRATRLDCCCMNSTRSSSTC